MLVLFTKMLLGHLVGDYLAQPKYMALHKSKRGWQGLIQCLLHSLLYTGSICLLCWQFDPVFAGLVFLSHFPIDRWSLGNKWLKLIKGRDLESAHLSTDQYREFDIAFTCIVYTIVDNTMHILLLWAIAHLW